MRTCDATLVPLESEVSDDARRVFDVALPRAGCGRLVCTVCNADVSIERGARGRGARAYACGCSKREVEHQQWPERDEDSISVCVPPWRCGGHRETTLPFTVDGFVVGEDVDVARLFEHAFSPSIAAKSPDDWVSRVRHIAVGTPVEQRIDLAPLDLLTHADVRVRGLAVTRARADCRAKAGASFGHTIVSALREHHALFDGAMEDRLVAELARTSPWPIRSDEARDFLRSWLLESPRAALASWETLFGILSSDRDWLLDHARALLDAAPALTGPLMEAIEHTSLGELPYRRLDVEVLRRCALALAGTRKRRVFEWLREHDAEWAAKNIADADKPKPPPSPPRPAPPRWSELEIARFDELTRALGNALRAGAKYSYRDQDSNWVDCALEDGKVVWRSGYYMDDTTWPPLELAGDDAFAHQLTTGLRDHPKLAIEALERALQSMTPRGPAAAPHAPPPREDAPPDRRFKTTTTWGIRFLRYSSGAVKQGFLDAPCTIDGYDLTCEIAFYESGRLKAGRLRAPATIQGIQCYDVVSFFESGKLRAAKLYDVTTIARRTFTAAQYVDLDEAGRVRAGCLDATRTFVRIDEGGYATNAVVPPVATSSWEKAQGSRRTYAWLSEQGMVYGSGSNQFDDAAGENPLREVLSGAIDEPFRSDFGEKALRDMHESALTLYRAVSDCPLDFEVD